MEQSDVNNLRTNIIKEDYLVSVSKKNSTGHFSDLSRHKIVTITIMLAGVFTWLYYPKPALALAKY